MPIGEWEENLTCALTPTKSMRQRLSATEGEAERLMNLTTGAQEQGACLSLKLEQENQENTP